MYSDHQCLASILCSFNPLLIIVFTRVKLGSERCVAYIKRLSAFWQLMLKMLKISASWFLLSVQLSLLFTYSKNVYSSGVLQKLIVSTTKKIKPSFMWHTIQQMCFILTGPNKLRHLPATFVQDNKRFSKIAFK